MRQKFVALLLLAAFTSLCVPAWGAGAYMGINMEAWTDPPGVILTMVSPNSPAWNAGLQPGDIVTALNGEGFGTDAAKLVEVFRAKLAPLNPGDTVRLSVIRRTTKQVLYVNGKEVPAPDPAKAYQAALAAAKPGDTVELKAESKEARLDVDVTLGERPAMGAPMPANADLGFDFNYPVPDYKPFIEDLLKQNNIDADYRDLLNRLAATHSTADPFRRKLMSYVHRDAFSVEPVSREIVGRIAAQRSGDKRYDPRETLISAADLLDISFGETIAAAKTLAGGRLVARKGGTATVTPGLPDISAVLKTGITPVEHVAQITKVLEDAKACLDAAFARLTPEDIEFVQKAREGLTDAFLQGIYIHTDPDNVRREDNLRLLKLAEKVGYADLIAAEMSLLRLGDADYLAGLKADLEKVYAAKLAEPTLEEFDSPYGKIIFGGRGNRWYASTSAAVIIDLGGNDLYTNNAGSGSGYVVEYALDDKGAQIKTNPIRQPFGVVIDFAGDDTYNSTRRWEIGSGSLGCGFLFDLSGNDQYVARQWGQGTALFGVGVLVDMEGNDEYRGQQLCQGSAIFGAAVFADLAGNDRYEGHQFCQGLAGSGAASIFLEGGGDDNYYSSGDYPTNYGDPGLFDGWSQGSAIGFRLLASGGIAVLVDCAGTDRYQAGHFSQGGGYYFGWGIFADVGHEGDLYIGSRYNQGFSAHEAVGTFLEYGGDDHYKTLQAVAQGLAWDECVTLFCDDAGNDVYEGGGGFSLGASAHNAICLVFDRGGNDRYDYPAGQARAGGNDYHGGTSLSFFLDSEGTDSYNAAGYADNTLKMFREYGIFLDIAHPLADMMDKPVAEWGLATKIELEKPK